MGKETGPRGWKNPTTVIAVAVIVITILFIPMVPARESYNQTEEYGREARYEVASVTFEEESELPGGGTYHVSRVVVKNIDPYGGTFWVTHFLYDANGLQETKITGEYLSAGQNKTFGAEFDTQGLQDVIGGYSVSPPTVIDRRVVTKYRTIYKSVIELLIYH